LKDKIDVYFVFFSEKGKDKMDVGENFWYGVLVVREIVFQPIYIAQDIYEAAKEGIEKNR
jgi:hypothetical protein